jgi:hypothetical protein
MKTKKHLQTIFGTFLVLSFVLISCRTSEKAAVSCPEFSINKNNKVANNHKRIRNKTLNAQHIVTSKKQPVRLSRNNQGKDIIVSKNSPVQDDDIVPGIESVSDLNKIGYSKVLTASNDNAIIPLGRNNPTSLSLKKEDMTKHPKDLIIPKPSGCDTIVLKSGSLLIGKVEEIGQNEIKYRKCNNLTGPIISILKSDVSVIIYTNGSRDFFSSNNVAISSQNNAITSDNNATIKIEELGLAGFVSSFVGLFILGTPLGLIGVIFGVISLLKIKKHPDKFKGRGFAITSLIVGLIDIVAIILILTSV